jgi:hypothetical protein
MSVATIRNFAPDLFCPWANRWSSNSQVSFLVTITLNFLPFLCPGRNGLLRISLPFLANKFCYNLNLWTNSIN